MEKDDQLRNIISGYYEKWNHLCEEVKNSNIESALKKIVELKIGEVHFSTIEEFENKSSKKIRKAYENLSYQKQKELDEDYRTKLYQICRFLNSFCAKIIVLKGGVEIRYIPSVLKSENYFSVLPDDVKSLVRHWMTPLCEYFLHKKYKEISIPQHIFSERVYDDICKNSIIDQWSPLCGDFHALAQWVSDFVDAENTVILTELERKAQLLADSVNPKFYLLKVTDKGSAIVFNEFGELYVFPKSKAPILYAPCKYSSDFKKLLNMNSKMFPIFNPEEW